MADAQIFVKIDEYKDVLRTIGLIKSKLNDAKATLQKLREIKTHEDSELENWDNKLKGIEDKIEGIDRILFEPSPI